MSYFSIVTPSIFNGKNAKADNNEKMPVILSPVFGTMPRERIINGTIAENLGLEVGNTYLIQAVFVDNVNPATGLVRQQIQVTNLGLVSTTELALNRKKFIDQMGVGKVEGAINASATAPKVTEEEGEPVGAGVPDSDADPLG